jgi:UDP-N-acetylmuramate--alanine ligase
MKIPVPTVLLPASALGRVHFIGIGGSGLSGIARIMLASGVTVSGSDQNDSAVLDALRALGAVVGLGHDARHVHNVETVVVSTAVREDNPEYLAALKQGLRVLPRSAALASVMAGKRTIAVAGTHGKTTTTSLLTVALQSAGLDPTYAIGGELTSTGTNAGVGAGDLFVAEADESDGAFLVYSPHGAIITNVDADHLDQWGTEKAYRAAFSDFLGRIDKNGFLVIWADSEATVALAQEARDRGLRTITYGERSGSDWTFADIRTAGGTSQFTISGYGQVRLQIPGRHYVHNALGALVVGLELGANFTDLAAGLASFTGTRRRMEFKGQAHGIRVYDSYAHHPREIAGDLQAAREIAGVGRVIVAFQPHLVSRTRIFGVEMGNCLGAADEVIVLDVYHARESVDDAVSGRLVADAVPLFPEQVAFIPDFDEVPAALVARSRPGDVVLTLGAGDVTDLAPQVLAHLRADE